MAEAGGSPGNALPMVFPETFSGPGEGVRGVVILHHGHVVLERYRPDVDPAAPQPLNSITKSVLGMLVGVTLQRGELRSVHAPVRDLVPEADGDGIAAQVRELTLWDLMSMRAGFDWDERQVDDCLLHACERFDHGARLHFILGRAPAMPPGTHFCYDSHAAHLLAIALTRLVERPIDEYARAHLFAPLGIESVDWEQDEDGIAFGGRGLQLSTRDLARLGLLMRHEGEWGRERVLPRDYVRWVTRRHQAGGFPLEDTLGYSGLWWTPADAKDEGDAYFAFGFGEQLLAVDPVRELVVAVTADSSKAPKGIRAAWDELRATAGKSKTHSD